VVKQEVSNAKWLLISSCSGLLVKVASGFEQFTRFKPKNNETEQTKLPRKNEWEVRGIYEYGRNVLFVAGYLKNISVQTNKNP